MRRGLRPYASGLDMLRMDRSGEWEMAYDGPDRAIVNADGVVIARMTREATPDEFEMAVAAAGDIAFLVGLVDRAAARVRELDGALRAFRAANDMPGEDASKSKDHAAEASMKLDDLHFRQFLRWHPGAQPVGGASGDRDPVDTAADRLRAILSITSRRELNTDPQAAQRWIELRDEWNRFRRMTDAERAAAYPGYGSAMRETEG